MALSQQARKRLTIAYLCLGLPIYIVLAVALMSHLPRPPMWVELAIYVVLGLIWAVPLRQLAKGTGRGTAEQEAALRKERTSD